MRLTHFMLATLVVLFVSFTAERAFASGEGAHAAGCRPINSANSGVQVISNGFYNPTSSPKTIICGSARLTASSPTRIDIHYKDNSGAGEIFCLAAVNQWNGGGVLWSQAYGSGVGSTGENALRVTIPSNIVGYVTLSCAIPGVSGTSQSVLRGFRWL